jgi:DNA-binding beta-propeller fold protein YncE
MLSRCCSRFGVEAPANVPVSSEQHDHMKHTSHTVSPSLSVWRQAVCTSLVVFLALSQTAIIAKPPPKAPAQIGGFRPIATYHVSGDVAEIVTATPDGTVLVYTDSESQEIGFVNIQDPANPTEITTIGVAGEPTSVAITPNGRWVLAVVHGEAATETTPGTPDHIAVFDLQNLAAAPVIKILGGQPDSIAISADGRYAAIAIENERDEDVLDGLLPQLPAGFLTIVDLVGAPADWTLRAVDLTGIAERFPEDPEPEFVDINAANQVAVTLQENNHVVIVDLASGNVVDDFPAGTVTHLADLEDDGQIIFDDLLTDSRREPDAIHWTPTGLLVTADEGDYNLDTDFVGGRGFTIFSATGNVLFDSGAELEIALASAGLYDDTRSDAKGSEPEGIEIAQYGNHTFLFVGMERAKPGAVAVYLLNGSNELPLLVQILETGNRPEGLLALPQRGLFVTANEGDGTISIFAGVAGR